MPTKRKLADLYVRGKNVTLDDGVGEPVTVWLQKLSPVDMEKVVRRANAYRARLMLDSRDENSEAFLSARSEIESLTRDELLDLVAESDVGTRALAIEAEIESDERWSKDGYIQGLQDAWNDGMRDRYDTDPEDPEAKSVFDALTGYTDFVTEKLVNEKARVRTELAETRSDEQLRKKVAETAVMSRVDLQWMAEFRRGQIWLSVRESEKDRSYYFTTREEVDDLAQDTLVQLIKAYTDLEVDVIEGKGSEVTPPSSLSSEPQVGGPSGPTTAA